jgi:glycosyltransferase involved in cell wall biosynthesis
MRIAIFDYMVTPSNPIGGCHHKLVANLCGEHEFTVFSVRFENPDPRRVKWVRIPAPRRPLVLLFTAFHVLAPIYYWFHRFFGRTKFDLIQGVESNLSFADVAYSQFCHQEYLAKHWQHAGGTRLRRLFSWLDHTFHAWTERPVYRRIRRIVVPSYGLARELSREYPDTNGKVSIVANPVDLSRMRRPADFDAQKVRCDLGITAGSIVLVFVALGHFERKGLPLLLEALRMLHREDVKLVVLGGALDLIQHYKSRAAEQGLSAHVFFAGMQRDIRPYLWAADAFVFPSAYEVFSLAVLEAAAAGLPIIVTRLNGAEEFMQDAGNGFVVDRTPDGVRLGLQRFLDLSPQARARLGEQAQRDVQRYSVERFSDAWRAFYDQQILG